MLVDDSTVQCRVAPDVMNAQSLNINQGNNVINRDLLIVSNSKIDSVY